MGRGSGRRGRRRVLRLGRPDAPLAGYHLRPAHLREDLDAINDRVYHTVNNGVYVQMDSIDDKGNRLLSTQDGF